MLTIVLDLDCLSLITINGLFYKYFKISDNSFIEKKLNQMNDTWNLKENL